MMLRLQTMWALPDTDDFASDVQRLFDDLDRSLPNRTGGAPGGVIPALDVIETATTIDVLIDLPGVDAAAVRVVVTHGVLIIAGEKCGPVACGADERRFHHVERGYGRFARVVRFSEAIEGSRARAAMIGGVLRVSVPRFVERRGREIVVPIDTTRA
jgi:HSP20 family protein